MVDKRSSQSGLGAQVLASLVLVHKYFPVLSWCTSTGLLSWFTSTSQFCFGTHALVSLVMMHKYWQSCLGGHVPASFASVHMHWSAMSWCTSTGQSRLGGHVPASFVLVHTTSFVLVHMAHNSKIQIQGLNYTAQSTKPSLYIFCLTMQANHWRKHH